jgi:hypothetical protein
LRVDLRCGRLDTRNDWQLQPAHQFETRASLAALMRTEAVNSFALRCSHWSSMRITAVMTERASFISELLIDLLVVCPSTRLFSFQIRM